MSSSKETTLPTAKPLIFPWAVLNQHLVMLGKTGAGKSSALRHVVEALLEKAKRVCVIDPKGDWWGLKTSADGKAAGFPVILFGDFKEPNCKRVPINPSSGKRVAKLVASGNRPCVIGFRGWTTADMTRFWIDFAEALFALNAGELYLVGDEFHNFAPKGKVLSPQAGLSLHWSNRILSEGRGLGIVCLIASQRPQKVHNDTLTSCETLVAMRVIHKADRDAVKDWIDGAGDPKRGTEVLNALAGLPRGQAYVWSPEIKFGPELLSFPLFTTLDSFAPPQLQKKVSGAGWADVNLEEVQREMAAEIEEEKANDPKELKAKIAAKDRELARLTKELEAAETAKPQAAGKVKIVEKRVVTDAQIARLEKLDEGIKTFMHDELARVEAIHTDFSRRTESFWEKIIDHRAAIVVALRTAREIANQESTTRGQKPGEAGSTDARTLAIGNPALSGHTTKPNQMPQRVARDATEGGAVGGRTVAAIDGAAIGKPQQRVLDALAWWESIGVAEVDRTRLGAVASINPSGGYIDNVLKPLTAAGMVERSCGVNRLTDAGRAAAAVPANTPTLSAYHDKLRLVVKGGTSIRALAVVIAGGARKSWGREEFGTAAGINPSGGYLDNVLKPLSALGLIDRRGGQIYPTAVLFPEGLR